MEQDSPCFSHAPTPLIESPPLFFPLHLLVKNNKFVQVNRVILIYVISCGFRVAFCKCVPLFIFLTPPPPPLKVFSDPRPAPPISINDTTSFHQLIIFPNDIYFFCSLLQCVLGKNYDLIVRVLLLACFLYGFYIIYQRIGTNIYGDNCNWLYGSSDGV